MSSGFSGFLRFSELSRIRMSDIVWHDNYMQVKINQSKTDIYRRENYVIIGKTVMSFALFIGLRDIFSQYVEVQVQSSLCLPQLFFIKINKYLATNTFKSLSYTRAREILLSVILEIGLDSSKYALHSSRSGGATTVVNNKVPDSLLEVNGRWASETAKDGYIEVSIEQKILVSMNVGLLFTVLSCNLPSLSCDLVTHNPTLCFFFLFIFHHKPR